eukprot:gene557-1071_t
MDGGYFSQIGITGIQGTRRPSPTRLRVLSPNRLRESSPSRLRVPPSPNRLREYSPNRRSDSPARLRTSPSRLNGSPSRLRSSPERLRTSPARQRTSPFRENLNHSSSMNVIPHKSYHQEQEPSNNLFDSILTSAKTSEETLRQHVTLLKADRNELEHRVKDLEENCYNLLKELNESRSQQQQQQQQSINARDDHHSLSHNPSEYISSQQLPLRTSPSNSTYTDSPIRSQITNLEKELHRLQALLRNKDDIFGGGNGGGGGGGGGVRRSSSPSRTSPERLRWKDDINEQISSTDISGIKSSYTGPLSASITPATTGSYVRGGGGGGGESMMSMSMTDGTYFDSQFGSRLRHRENSDPEELRNEYENTKSFLNFPASSSTSAAMAAAGSREVNVLHQEMKRLEEYNRELLEKVMRYETDATRSNIELSLARKRRSGGESVPMSMSIPMSSYESGSGSKDPVNLFESEVRRLQSLLREEHSQATKTISELEEQALHLQNEKVNAQREVLSLKSELELHRLRTGSLEHDLSLKSQYIDDLKKQLQSGSQGWMTELNFASTSEANLRVELKRAQGNVLGLTERCKSYETELSDMKEDLSQLQSYIDKLKTEFQETNDQQLSAFQTEVRRLQGLIRDQNDRAIVTIRELEEQVLHSQNDRVNIQREFSSMKSELELHRLRTGSLEHDLSHKSDQLTSAMDSSYQAREEAKRLDKTATELREKVSQYEFELVKLRTELLSVRKSESDAREHMVISHRTENDRLQSLVNEEFKKSSLKVVELEEQIRTLTSEKNTLNAFIVSLKGELELAQIRIETLEDDLSTRGQHYESQRKQWDSQRIDLQAELSRLMDTDGRSHENTRRLEKTVKDLESDLSARETLISRQREEIAKYVMTLNKTEEKLADIVQSDSTKYTMIQTLTKEVERYKYRLESVENDVLLRRDDYEQEIRTLDAEKKDLEFKLNVCSDSENRLRVETRRLEITISDMKEKLAYWEEDATKLRQEVLMIHRSESEARSDLQASLDSQVTSLQIEIKRLTISLKEEQSKAAQTRREADAEIDTLNDESQAQNQEIQALRMEAKTAHQALEAMEKEMKQRIQHYEKTKIHLEDSLTETRSRSDMLVDNESRLQLEVRQSTSTIVELNRRLESVEVEYKTQLMQISRLKQELEDEMQASRRWESRSNEWHVEKISFQKNVSTLTTDCELYRSRAETLEQDLTQKILDHERQRRLLESSKMALESQVSLLTETENRLRSEIRRIEQTVEDLTQRNIELETNLKDHELEIWKEEREANVAQRALLDAQKLQLSLEEEIAVQKNQIERLRSETTRHMEGKDELSAQLQSLQIKYNSSQVEINSLRTELELSISKLETLSESSSRKEQELSKRTRLADSNKSSLEGHISKLAESEARLRAELLRSEQNNEDLIDKVRHQETNVKSLQSEIISLRNSQSQISSRRTEENHLEIQGLHAEIQSLQNSLQEEKIRTNRSKKELELQNISHLNDRARLQRDLSICQSELEVARAQAEHRESELSRHLQELEKQAQELIEEVRRGKLQLQGSTATQQEMRLHADLEKALKSNTELSERKRKLDIEVVGLRSEAVIYRKAYERAIEEMKSMAVDIQDNDGDGDGLLYKQRVSADGKELSAGSGTGSRDAFRKYETLLETTRTENTVAQKTLITLRSELELARKRIDSLEKDAMFKGSAVSNRQRQLEADNNELEDHITRLKREMTQLQHANMDGNVQIEKYKAIESQLRMQLKEMVSSVSVEELIAEHRSKWDDQRQMLQKEIQRQVVQSNSLQEEINKIQRQKDDIEQKMERMMRDEKSQTSSLQSEINLLKQRNEALESECKVLQEKIRRAAASSPDSKDQRLEMEVRSLREALASSQGRHNDDMSAARRTEALLRETVARLEEDKTELENRIGLLVSQSGSRDNRRGSSMMAMMGGDDDHSLSGATGSDHVELSKMRKDLMRAEEQFQLCKEELRISQHRVDTLTEQNIQITADYDEQIAQLESLMREAKISPSPTSGLSPLKLETAWEMEKFQLERDLKKANALIKILQEKSPSPDKAKDKRSPLSSSSSSSLLFPESTRISSRTTETYVASSVSSNSSSRLRSGVDSSTRHRLFTTPR